MKKLSLMWLCLFIVICICASDVFAQRGYRPGPGPGPRMGYGPRPGWGPGPRPGPPPRPWGGPRPYYGGGYYRGGYGWGPWAAIAGIGILTGAAIGAINSYPPYYYGAPSPCYYPPQCY